MYLNIFKWPVDNKLLIKGLNKKINSANLLADKKINIHYKSVSSGTELNLPAMRINKPFDKVIVLEL